MDVRTSTRLRRDRSTVPAARAFITHGLRIAGASAETIERLELALAEACNNVVYHAAGSTFTVDLMVDGDRAMVAVADHGSGFVPQMHRGMPPPLATGNRGIPLMQALVEQVEMFSDPAGTTVVLVHPLGAVPSRRAPQTADR